MYIPTTDAEEKAMLERIGVDRIEDLFDVIPDSVRLKRPLSLPAGMSELELTGDMEQLARQNQSCEDLVCFLGGGCYDHFIPAVVDTIASRSEYYTAYTPYQAEVSQGTLQTAFEFQTLMCELTGLAVSNASLYEGATAVVEAVHLAIAATKRPEKVIVSETVHPEYRQTLATYFANWPVTIETIPMNAGVTDLGRLRSMLDEKTAAVIMQSPNFLGLVEPIAEVGPIAHEKGSLMIQSFDPISLGMLKRPGDMGVDVAVAEGQGLGVPMSFGGPFLGIIAATQDHLRRMPGRIVGETVDRRGQRCFSLTLQTREQHIRREKATSNICSNQALLALRASVYLSLLGPRGLEEVAHLCWHKSHYAADQLTKIPGVRLAFGKAFFKEFVIELPMNGREFLDQMLDLGFHAGIALDRFFPSMDRHILMAVTEKRTRAEIDDLVDEARSVIVG